MKQPELGQRILELRKQKGLTLDELVDLCNINVRTLQRIENGEVSPRSYTIKTILSALDYDYESLEADSVDNLKDSRITINTDEVNSVHTLLTVSWIAGICLLIVSTFEGVGDYFRYDDGDFIFGQWGHLAIKVATIVFYIIFLYGFLISGKLLKNFVMKVSSILFMIALVCFYTYDIISIFSGSMNFEVVVLAQAVAFGALGLLFGISILKSRPIIGTTGLVSGIAELVMAFCLLTVVLAPVAFFLFITVVLLEILVLYKISTLVKDQLP